MRACVFWYSPDQVTSRSNQERGGNSLASSSLVNSISASIETGEFPSKTSNSTVEILTTRNRDQVALFCENISVSFCEKMGVGFFCQWEIIFLSGEKSFGFVGEVAGIVLFTYPDYRSVQR